MRSLFIDRAKGIGIILVCFGHMIPYQTFWAQVIYSFHMPLFFFLSGTCFSGRMNKSFTDNVRGIVNRMAVPYFIFAIIGLLALFAREGVASVIGISELKGIALSVLYKCAPRGNGNLWFLVALAGGSLLLRAVLPVLERGNKMRAAIFLLCAFSLTWTVIRIYPYPRPFQVDKWLVVSAFMFLGWKCRRYIPMRLKFGVDIGLIFVCLLILMACAKYESVWAEHLARPTVLVTGPIGTLMIFSLSRLISRVRILTGLVEFIGENSLVFFALDAVVRPCMAVLFNQFGLSYVITSDRVLAVGGGRLTILLAAEIASIALVCRPTKKFLSKCMMFTRRVT